MVVDRRRLLALLGAGSVGLLTARLAEATVARAIALGELVKRSKSVVVAVPVSAYSEWAYVGDSRRIVTVTRVRVDEHVARSAPDTSELLVRTLGGRVGNLGQVVAGEAELRTSEPCVLFVEDDAPGLSCVTAMAQGHYPLVSVASGRTLKRSPGLAQLVMRSDAAVERLSGQTLEAASRMVRDAVKP